MRVRSLALLFVAVSGSQADACMVGGWRTNWTEAKETMTTMSVESGKGCAALTGVSGTSIYTKVYISTQAKNGFAEIRPGNSPGYRSRQGFKGEDEFVATFCGEGRSGKGCPTVRIKVTVY
jgi:hypothetical protein